MSKSQYYAIIKYESGYSTPCNGELVGRRRSMWYVPNFDITFWYSIYDGRTHEGRLKVVYGREKIDALIKSGYSFTKTEDSKISKAQVDSLLRLANLKTEILQARKDAVKLLENKDKV